MTRPAALLTLPITKVRFPHRALPHGGEPETGFKAEAASGFDLLFFASKNVVEFSVPTTDAVARVRGRAYWLLGSAAVALNVAVIGAYARFLYPQWGKDGLAPIILPIIAVSAWWVRNRMEPYLDRRYFGVWGLGVNRKDDTLTLGFDDPSVRDLVVACSESAEERKPKWGHAVHVT